MLQLAGASGICGLFVSKLGFLGKRWLGRFAHLAVEALMIESSSSDYIASDLVLIVHGLINCTGRSWTPRSSSQKLALCSE